MLHACHFKNRFLFYGRFTALDGSVDAPHRRLAGDCDFVADMVGELVSFTLELMGRPIVFGEPVMTVSVRQAALNGSQAGRLAHSLACVLRLQASGRD